MTIALICILLVVWNIFVIAQACVHANAIEEDGAKPIYIIWFLIRGIAAILHGILFDVSNMLEYWPILIYQITSHFVIFNPTLNYFRYKVYNNKLIKFWYLGKESGWIDEFLVGRPWVYKVFYFMCLAAMVYATFWIFNMYHV